MKTTLVRALLLCVFLISIPFITFAQEELTETFVSEDGALAFQYPDGWEVDEASGLINLVGATEDAAVVFTFFPPDFVEIFVSGSDTAVEALDTMAESLTFITGDAEEFPSALDSAIAPTEQNDIPGVALMKKLSSGRFAMLLAQTIDVDTAAGIIFDVFNSMDSGTPGSASSGNNTTSSDEGFPQLLTNHAGEWQDAVEELEENGVIASGGSLVFNENRAFFSGQGNFFTPLARNSPYADIIMAGELTFNVGNLDELEQCVLTSRIETDNRGNATKFLDVGFLNDGTLFVIDVFSRSEDPVFTFSQESLDLEIPHHILYLAQDNTVTVYLNGELIIENFEIENRAGTYGISLLGRGPSAQCVGNNIWVYQAPAFNPGVCEVSAASTVNKRSGPGTNFDRAGQLGAGVVEMAVGQGSDGDFIWWQLEDDTWVREDVVRAVGDCRNLPDAE